MPEVEKVREVEKKEVEKEVERKEIEREDTLEVCPECGSPRLIRDYRRGEFICQDCGLVIEETYIDAGPEWRAFDSEQKEKRSRVGAPVTYTIHDKGLSTIIDWSNKDYYGKSISVRNRAQLFRLRKWQRRIRISNATERNLAFALSELDRMASALGLPKSVRETAAVIYRKAVDKNLIRGRSIEGVVAAALYAACRQAGVPRTLDEIATYSRVDRKEIGRTYRFIARELGLKLMPTSPADYVPRFCAALGLSGDVQKKAIEIIKKAEEKELTSGRGPTGVAAAAIYIASILGGERRTQREVAEVAGVTEVTIRNRYKELAERLGIEIIL
ncbi:MAG: transcription initiation factor IIB [Archaeoglobales archaeon]|nr:MAG: transcription initiation factor IIB [Archaeoglobales archaeon]